MAEQCSLSFTDELLETTCIFCALCKDLLKPPIMLVENIGNICSICYDDKQELRDWRALNNSALETVLKILKLPCKFKLKGCQERLFYEELIHHQQSCKHRTNMCSLFKISGCKWEGSTADFVDHFKETHGNHVVNFENNLFFLQTSLQELDLVKLLVMKNQTYILRMQTNLTKNKLFYFICNVTDDDQISYEYSVKHKGASDNYIKTKSKILSAHNIYNDFDENIAVQVDLDALKQISNISDTITNVFKIKVNYIQTDGIDEKMLPFFECPVCKNFMKPPIYQCQSGHSICNLCRPRLEKCPTCRSMFGTTRNYSLEGLTTGVQYPCIYHDLGCTVTSSSSEIIKHENECTFKPHNCPFPNCTSTGNHYAIMSHLKDFHPDGVIVSGVKGYTESFRLDQNNLCYNKMFDKKCVIAFNHIFRLTCRRVSEHCLWAAEVLGATNPLKTFVYEVAIVDMRRPEKKLIRTDYCPMELPEDELFKRCIMFPNSILSSYSNHGMVTFHFTIKEK